MTTRKLFISYPHKPEHCVRNVILALKDCLVASSFDVWLDERIKTGHDWRQEITKGLQESEWVLIFLNSHSTRKDSICLDEIAMAVRYKQGQIVSVLLESEDMIKTPLMLGRIQFLRMDEWEKYYKSYNGGAEWKSWLQRRADELISAFDRRTDTLQQQVLNTLHEILRPDQYWGEIAKRLDGFVGREWIIEEVTKSLVDPDGPRVLWLNGGPGVGKTSIAARLAHDLELPTVGVYFCRYDRNQSHSASKVIRTLAYQMASSVPAYRQMLVKQLHLRVDVNFENIEVIKDELSKQTISELFSRLFVDPVSIGGGPLLLIIDGLDEISTPGGDNEIAKLIAGPEFKRTSKWLRVLITSRPDGYLKEILSGVDSVQIDAQRAENIADLLEFLEQQVCFGEGEVRNRAIKTLLEKSEGIFVYASKAVEAIQRGIISIGEPNLFPSDLRRLYRTYLERLYPYGEQFIVNARPIIELILASPEPLPIDIAIAALGKDNYFIDEFIAKMGSLIDINALERQVRMSLFHRSFAVWLEDAAHPYRVDCNKGKAVLAKTIWEIFMNDGIFAMSNYVAEVLPMLMHSITKTERRKVIGSPSEYGISRVKDAVYSLKNVNRYNEAKKIQYILIEELTALKGENHIETAASLDALGGILIELGCYSDALMYREQALKIALMYPDIQHIDIATIYSNVAMAKRYINDNMSALKLFDKSLKINEKLYGETHQVVATNLNNLASTYRTVGEYDIAISLLERALDINKKYVDTDQSEYTTNLNNIAAVFHEIKKYDLSIKYLYICYELEEKKYGKEHKKTASCIFNISSALISLGNYADALLFAERALKIDEYYYGESHPYVAKDFRNIAIIKMMQKDNDSLVINLEKACQINEMFYGLESQIVSDDYYDIACAKRTQGNIDDAIMYFEKSYEIRKKMLLDPDIASADCLRSIGYLYITKLKYKEALVYLEKALAIYLIDKSGDNKKILQLGKDILILKNKISNNSVRGFKNTNTTSGGNSKIARNGPCPCGSHKKYKKCCGP